MITLSHFNQDHGALINNEHLNDSFNTELSGGEGIPLMPRLTLTQNVTPLFPLSPNIIRVIRVNNGDVVVANSTVADNDLILVPVANINPADDYESNSMMNDLIISSANYHDDNVNDCSSSMSTMQGDGTIDVGATDKNILMVHLLILILL
jgi:hypothetical protein